MEMENVISGSIRSSKFADKAMAIPRKFPPEVVREKIRDWCGRGERAHSDVVQKLVRWGIPSSERADLIAELISDNLLNEERYAEAFASDHFRLRGWGPVKISYALKRKGVSERNTSRALDLLPKQDSGALMKKAFDKMQSKLHGLQEWKKRHKTAQYLISRGYAPDEVWAFVNTLFRPE